jgi:hypothetical protein
MKWVWVFAAGCLTALILPKLTWSEKSSQPLPTLFGEIQTMGELRTAKVEASRVVKLQSSLEAPGVLSVVVGLPQALEMASTSEAGVQVSGTIEAGVDLGQAEFTKTPEGVNVVLPKATLTPGRTQTQLLWSRESWLNRDKSLVLRASEKGKEELMKSAGTVQLLQSAERQAEATVRRLLIEAGAKEVAFSWKADSRSM